MRQGEVLLSVLKPNTESALSLRLNNSPLTSHLHCLLSGFCAGAAATGGDWEARHDDVEMFELKLVEHSS